MFDQTKTRRAMYVALCLILVLGAYAETKKKRVPPPHLDQAYFGGELVKIESVPVPGTRPLVVGPWNLGPKVNAKPSDKRPNMYFVSPGTQHQISGRPEFNHNEVLSAVPKNESDFDVWWVVVLDPTMKEEFTSEQQIILATQQTFVPGVDFDFNEIPSVGFLKTFLKVHDVEGLDRFKRPEGDLPRVAIVRAGFTVRAQAEPIEQPVNAEAAASKEH